MDAPSLLVMIFFNAAAYALAFAAGALLVESLARPWRRAGGAHWTERARLAFAPGFALLLLAVYLPVAAAAIGGACLEALLPRLQGRMVGFGTVWLATLAGVMTMRYRWLREVWGARVTVRSWLAGCLVLALLIIPHLLVVLLLILVLPETPDARAALLFAGGVAAVAFFIWGGGLWLLRLAGIAKPAPGALQSLVDQLAAGMRVPGPIRVYELEWAQVNAVALVLQRTVGFSRALLAVMTPDEVRGIAAHELGHLLESRRVRAVRVGHAFAYLAAAPLMKYGGPGGIAAGMGLMMALLLGYKRFTRAQEQRADHLEREAIGDANAYMGSMIKLHEANLSPAVMPGTQTHPHLYDRLLAGGIQPDFPRPQAPTRSRPVLAAVTGAILTVALLFMLTIAIGLVQRLVRDGL